MIYVITDEVWYKTSYFSSTTACTVNQKPYFHHKLAVDQTLYFVWTPGFETPGVLAKARK